MRHLSSFVLIAAYPVPFGGHLLASVLDSVRFVEAIAGVVTPRGPVVRFVGLVMSRSIPFVEPIASIGPDILPVVY